MKKVCLGKVVKLHGYKGQMKIRTQFDDDFQINQIKKLYDKENNEFIVTKVFKTNDGIVVSLADVDLEKANSFIGNEMYIDRELLKDKILIEDLKNSKVYFENGNLLGTILDVNDYGSAEVFTIKNPQNKEILFPNVKGLIIEFNLDEKKLTINEQRFKEVSDED